MLCLLRKKEIVEVIKNLKEAKASNDIPIAFIKCATDSKEFITEIVQLYQSVWETNVIPKCWGHSKLVALWKGASKGKSNDATSYRGLQNRFKSMQNSVDNNNKQTKVLV